MTSRDFAETFGPLHESPYDLMPDWWQLGTLTLLAIPHELQYSTGFDYKNDIDWSGHSVVKGTKVYRLTADGKQLGDLVD